VDGSFGDDVRVQAVAEVDGVDVVTTGGALLAAVFGTAIRVQGINDVASQALSRVLFLFVTRQDEARQHEESKERRKKKKKKQERGARAYHSRSLYIMVKKTWRKRLTAFISTAKR